MNPFQKLAYEIRRGQLLREKTASVLPVALAGAGVAALPEDADASDIALGAAGAAGGTMVTGELMKNRMLAELVENGKLSGKSRAILALSAPLGYGLAQGAKHLYRGFVDDIESGPGFNPSPAAAMSLGAGLGTATGAGLGLGIGHLSGVNRKAKALGAMAGTALGGLSGMYAGKKLQE